MSKTLVAALPNGPMASADVRNYYGCPYLRKWGDRYQLCLGDVGVDDVCEVSEAFAQAFYDEFGPKGGTNNG